MTNDEIRTLIEAALDARNNSYCPYSGYAVGAALLARKPVDTGSLIDGRVSEDIEASLARVNSDTIIYKGCNIENSSYGATNCAERTAIFKAVSEGVTQFEAIAITGAPKGEVPRDYAYPCGICRQVMAEFCDMDFTVIVAISSEEYKIFKLKELLPEAFSASNME